MAEEMVQIRISVLGELVGAAEAELENMRQQAIQPHRREAHQLGIKRREQAVREARMLLGWPVPEEV